MNKQIKSLVFLLLFVSNISFAVEDSVIPLMEQYEIVENLPAKKFTTRQLQEIAEALAKKENKVRLVTYNMLFNLYDHNLAEENRWPNRLPRIVDLVQAMKPDIICTQELYPDQVQDLSGLLNEDFDFFVGQKDEDGESYGIFFRKDRFELLSSTVNYPLSMIQLRDLKTGKTFAVFNTHMPFSNLEKREANAHAIVQIIEPYSQEMPVIFTGDLNTFPSRLDLAALPFYDGDYIHRILSKGPLRNSHELSLLGHFGPISTFTNQDPDSKPFQGTGTPGILLDYIYVSNQVNVLSHAVENGKVGGHFPSDHMPLLIDFLIK